MRIGVLRPDQETGLAQMVDHLTRHWVVVSSSLTPGQTFALYYYINSCYYSSDCIACILKSKILLESY